MPSAGCCEKENAHHSEDNSQNIIPMTEHIVGVARSHADHHARHFLLYILPLPQTAMDLTT